MIFWMSITAIGSTPAKGSSSRMKRGLVARARAISTRRRSPPESEAARFLRMWVMCSSCSSFLALVHGAFVQALQFQHGAHVLGHRELPEHRVFLGQVGQAQLGALVDRHMGQALVFVAVLDADLAAVGATRPTIM
jgi:hypothetical protein